MSSEKIILRIAELQAEIPAYELELTTLKFGSDEYADTNSDLSFTLAQISAFEEMLALLNSTR